MILTEDNLDDLDEIIDDQENDSPVIETVKDAIAVLKTLPPDAFLQVEVSDESLADAADCALDIGDVFIDAKTGCVILKV